MARNKTVLITGSLGYLGSVLSPYLEARGYTCVGYDAGFFHTCTLSAPSDPPTRVRDAQDFHVNDLDGVDAVIHLAGISNDPFGTLPPERIYDPTRVYALRIASLCKMRGIRFIFASSCSVYGVGGGGLLNEESETHPQTPYSLNKLQIEHGLQDLSDARFCPILLRFATVFGMSPRMRFDLFVNMFIGMALTTRKILLNSDGQAWRPNIHIQDVCKAIWCCLEHAPRAKEAVVLNVGDTRHNYRVLEVAKMVQEAVPRSELVYLSTEPQRLEETSLFQDQKICDNADRRTYQVSCERITHVLPGFQCNWTVPAGIQALCRELAALPLTEAQLKRMDFYRLQRLEWLWNTGQLTEELSWKDGRRSVSVSAEMPTTVRCV